MIIWDRLLSLLGLKRDSGPRYFELDETLHTALTNLADQEQRPEEEIHADLLAAGLAQRHTHEELRQRWRSLSPREQDVTGFTCLGYTNRQMAARMGISVETVKTHMSNALIKFGLHSKAELRQALSDWDFSKWDYPQQ